MKNNLKESIINYSILILNTLFLFLLIIICYSSIFLELKDNTNFSFIPLMFSFLWVIIFIFASIKWKANVKKLILLSIINVFFLITSFLTSISLGLFEFFQNDLSICKNEIFETVKSPNNGYKAVSYIKNCGATTDFSSQVSLGKSSMNDKDIINDDSSLIFVGTHSNFIKIKWGNNNTLMIIHDVIKDNIFKSAQQKNDIRIIYLSYWD